MSDDDWFESALSGDDEDEEHSESEENPWGDTDDTEQSEERESPWGDTDDTEQSESEDSPWGDADDDKRSDTADSPWDDSGDGETFGGETTNGAGEDSPFGSEASFDEEMSEGDSFDGSGESDPFGDDGGGFGSGNGGEFGGGEEDLFDDEGFGGLGGGGDSEFEEEDFESEIPRIDLGIEGLDNMIQGGIPERHLMTTIGSAGTGKTTFGLQFLHHGLINGENSVFITLEQSHEAIIATANEFGWDFESYEEEDRLAVVDLDPVEMANSLDNIQAELPRLIRDFDADRLVLDSVSLLEMMYDNQAKRRTEVFDFTRSLKKAGVTTFLTSEASENNAYASRHGIIEYLTDAVFVLQYVRGETQETRLAVEIQKIRNANHSREKKPYEMTDDGLSVYQQANIF
ncbi:KaiC domain-containing protein [Halovenus sp. HT40]|uniref:KaiC domain-containing protein n=1 Tax=Halovenus sp. HT40 TaxID=3126691 RepID=UPI00300EED96